MTLYEGVYITTERFLLAAGKLIAGKEITIQELAELTCKGTLYSDAALKQRDSNPTVWCLNNLNHVMAWREYSINIGARFNHDTYVFVGNRIWFDGTKFQTLAECIAGHPSASIHRYLVLLGITDMEPAIYNIPDLGYRNKQPLNPQKLT